MQEAADGDFVHLERFGKKPGIANEAAQALAEGIVETLHVIRGATLGVVGVCWGGQALVVALQGVGIKRTPTVSQRDTIPKESGGGIIARTQRVSNDLAGTPAQAQPQPDHPAPTRWRTQLHGASSFEYVQGLGGRQGCLQGRQILGFF